MADEKNGIADEISVEINATGEVLPNPDAKGPDPDQWDNVEDRKESESDTHPEDVKGPGSEWSDEARSERGADLSE